MGGLTLPQHIVVTEYSPTWSAEFERDSALIKGILGANCICGCPTAAIEYGKASKGKPRYQCPEYEQ